MYTELSCCSIPLKACGFCVPSYVSKCPPGPLLMTIPAKDRLPSVNLPLRSDVRELKDEVTEMESSGGGEAGAGGGGASSSCCCEKIGIESVAEVEKVCCWDVAVVVKVDEASVEGRM